MYVFFVINGSICLLILLGRLHRWALKHSSNADNNEQEKDYNYLLPDKPAYDPTNELPAMLRALKMEERKKQAADNVSFSAPLPAGYTIYKHPDGNFQQLHRYGKNFLKRGFGTVEYYPGLNVFICIDKGYYGVYDVKTENLEEKTIKPTDSDMKNESYFRGLPHGYTVYHDRERKFRQLRWYGQNILNRNFEGINYCAYGNVFICRAQERCAVYDVKKEKLVETTFYDITIDQYENKIYRESKHGNYGLLNDDYLANTPARYTQIWSLSKNLFRYYDGKLNMLMNEYGSHEVGYAWITDHWAEKNHRLIYNAQLEPLLYNNKGQFIKKLPHPLLYPGVDTTNFYVAGYEQPEILPGTDIHKVAFTVLSTRGEPMFSPLYDSLKKYHDDAPGVCIAGVGDAQLWDYVTYQKARTEEDEDEDDLGNTGMLYGVIDAHNTLLLPIEYNNIIPVTADLCMVNKGGSLGSSYGEDWNGDEYDETTVEWCIWMGKWGVMNLKGELIIPIEHEYLSFDRYGENKELFFRGTRSMKEGHLYYDINGERVE